MTPTSAYASLSDYVETSNTYNEKYGETLSTATVGGLTFIESLTLSGDDYETDNFVYSENNYIYLYEDLEFSTSLLDSGQIVFNNYGNDLEIYQTSGTSGNNCYHSLSNSGDAVLYGVQDRSNGVLSTGESREYGTPAAGTPAFSITIKNAGYTSNGEYIDVVITYQYAYLYRYRDFNGETTEYPCLLHLFEGQPIFDIISLESMQDQSMFEINISFQYSDNTLNTAAGIAGELVDDALYVFDIRDLDVNMSSTNKDGLYSESIWFLDGFDNDIELAKSPETILALGEFTYSNNDSTYNGSVTSVTYGSLVRLYPNAPTDSDTAYANETLGSGFKTEITSGSFTFLWTGQGCGTELSLSAGGFGYTPPPPPTKDVDDTTVTIGDNITYTITESIPYTYDNGSYSNTFSSIVFSDTLDDALDGELAEATLAIYRTDTLNSSTQVDDTDNWKIEYNTSTNTITATCLDPSSAGGDYVFIFTTQVLDISEPIPNDAYFYYNNYNFVMASAPDVIAGEISLVKTATPTSFANAEAGVSTVTYLFTVTNTGSSTLTDITLTDPLLGGNITLEKTTLEPSESTTGTATYTLTQSNIDAGYVNNTATVTGKDTENNTVTDTDTARVTISQSAEIDLVKTVVGDKIIEDAQAGDTVRFAITVTNTGNTTLNNATITDLLDGATFVAEEISGVTFNSDSVVIATMTPGDSVTVYVDYQLTQADIDRGDTENIAMVVATPSGSSTTVSDEDDDAVETPSNPNIELTKTANVESIEFALPGDVIYYALSIVNTGNTTISNLTLYDELLGGDITEYLDKTTIAPGESATAIVPYSLTQEDIDAGYVYNEAVANGEDPDGKSTISTDDNTVELVSEPSLELTKTVAAANDVNEEDLTVGDELIYTLVITNNGNQTITNIALYDELLGGDIDLTSAVKGIDMTAIGYFEYETDSDETIDVDTATEDVATDETSADDDGADNEVTEADDNSEVDSIDADTTVVSDTVEGEETSDDDSVTTSQRVYYEEHTTISEDDPITTLRPGEYLIIEVSYTITQEDMDNGRIDNIATVTGEDPNGNGVADEDTAVMYLPQHPDIELTKDASLETLTAARTGDLVYYMLTVTNTGDVSLTNFVLTDELEGVVIDMSPLEGVTLAPGESVVVTAEYALTDADIQASSVYNHATVSAESVVPSDDENAWSGPQQVSDDDDALIEGIIAAGVADDLILAQTGDELLLLLVSVIGGLAATACVVAGYFGRLRRIK